MKRRSLFLCLILVGLCTFALSASAQIIGSDIFKVNYFANNGVSGAPDATVRIDNTGSATEAPGAESSDLYLCAMIYVFDNDQQMSECCGCLVTPDDLRTLSVGKDLTNNPLTGVVSNNGVIEIISALPNNSPCEPGSGMDPEPTLRAWATHIQNKVGSAYPISETAFSDAGLSYPEFLNLEEDCSFVERLGSGHGICSCGTGDATVPLG